MNEETLRFKICRKDGRSNQQVIIDHVKDLEPGTIIPYEQLTGELSVGTEQKFSRDRVQAIVLQAQPRLLREFQRTMSNLRGLGYRIAYAKEHLGLAHTRERKAELQMRRGLEVLKGVRWDELEPNMRAAHEGTLLLFSGLYAQISGVTRRTKNIEDALASVVKRVETVEEQVASSAA